MTLTARAEDREASPQSVIIWVDGDALALSRVRTAAEELFGRLEWTYRVVPLAQFTESFAPASAPLHAHLDLRSGATPSLVVVDARDRRELARRTLAPTTDGEVAVESLMHVLYLVSESIALRRERAVPRQRPAPSPARQVPKIRAPNKSRGPEHDVQRSSDVLFATGVLARVISFGPKRLLGGAGASVAVRLPAAPVGVGLVLWSAVHSSSEMSYDQFGARLRPVTIQLSPTLDVRLTPGLTSFAGLSAGMDCLLIDAKRAPIDARTAKTTATLDALIGGWLGARLFLFPTLALEAAVGVDLGLSPSKFAADIAGTRHTLLELPRLRPWLMLGGSFALSGRHQVDSQGEAR